MLIESSLARTARRTPVGSKAIGETAVDLIGLFDIINRSGQGGICLRLARNISFDTIVKEFHVLRSRNGNT